MAGELHITECHILESCKIIPSQSAFQTDIVATVLTRSKGCEQVLINSAMSQ